MRLNFSIALLLCTLVGKAQNDTIVYFTKLNRITRLKDDAFYYSELNHGKKGSLILKEYEFRDNNWKPFYEASIQKASDTSFTYFEAQNRKEVYVRSFIKSDSGYYVRNYSNTMLTDEGPAKILFPLVKEGHWKQYSRVDGKVKIEADYKDNQLIGNKYYIPGGGYIKDVFTYVDKNPDYEGGFSELLKFIGEHTNYPEKARDNNITGRVIVSFVLMADGSIQGIDFLQRVNILLDAEALRVINSVPKKKWKPAEIDNQKVNTPMMIPITFSIH